MTTKVKATVKRTLPYLVLAVAVVMR